MRTVQRAAFCWAYFASLCLATPSTTPNPQFSLQKRGLNLIGAALGGDTGFGGGSQSLKDPCGYIELTDRTWVDLGIDEYLAHYPNGDKLTLQEFAAELNVPNFFCGIGMECLAGQLCSPAVGVNWLILYAAQQWNNYMNSLYKAVENAVTLMREASSSIVSDFTSIEPADSSLYGWAIATVVCGVLGSFTAIMVPAFIPADAVLAAQAAAAAAPGFAATPEMAIGRTKDSPRAGQEAYNAAAAALASKNPKAFQDIQDYKDGNTIRDIFVPPREGGSQRHSSAWTPPSGVAKQMEQTVPPTAPYETTPGHAPASGHHSEPKPDEPSSSSSSTAPEPGKVEGSSSPDDSKPDNGPTSSPKTKRSLVPRSIKHKEGPPSPYAYTRYAYLEAHLNSIQNRIQGFVAVTAKLGTMAPLLAEGGIASVLSQGTYLNPNPTENELQEGGKALAQITALAQLFQSLKIFVTIGSDDCKGKGPNGAWLKKDRLSYCSPEGLMMNIIRAHEDKAVNQILNADLLKSKYGYTTEYLAKSAWECQKKYGVYTESAAPPPTNIRSDCVFPIAVCDCTLPDVAALRKKKKSTVVACRKGANLPI